MADERGTEASVIPPIWLDPIDLHILEFLRRRGPTYHINVSKALGTDIRKVRRHCHTLAEKGALERRGRTYYTLTEAGESLLADRRSSARSTDGDRVPSE